MHYPPNRPRIPLDVHWAEYWQALRQCDTWWKRGPKTFSVFPPGDSWVGVIRTLRPSMNQDWSRFDPLHQKRLLGCAAKADDNWALLGNMLGFAIRPVFGDAETIRSIETVVKSVIAEDAVFPDAAASAYARLTALDGIGPAIATRLLAVARPNRCVSWNSASSGGLATYAASVPPASTERNFYGRLLRGIYAQPWFSEPPSGFESRGERQAWSMRVALLDAFIYCPRTP